MNAPRTWPNISDASRFACSAPQSTATNGRARRREPSCSARATSSFPVPDSPWISTVVSVAATCRIICSSPRIATPLPSIRFAPVATSRAWSRRTSSSSRDFRPHPIAFSTTSASRSLSNGFCRKSKAPRLIADTASSIVPRPVRITTGTPGCASPARASTSKPLPSPSARSVITSSKARRSSWSCASASPAAVSTA